MDEEDWDVDIPSKPVLPISSTNFTTVNAVPVVSPPASNTTGLFKSSRAFGFGSLGRGRGAMLQHAGFGNMNQSERNNRPTFTNQNSYTDSSNHMESETTPIPIPITTSGSTSTSRSTYSGQENHDNNNNYAKSSFSNLTEIMSVETKSISSLIGKAGATINNIKDKCNVRVIIPPREEIQNQSHANIKIIGHSKDSIEKAIQMINEKTSETSYSSNNSYRPDHSRNRSNSVKRYHPYEDDKPKASFNSSHDDNKPKTGFGFGFTNKATSDTSKTAAESQQSTSTIDWDLVRSQPLQNLSKFKDHPPVVKDFYEEDPEITAMTREEVIEYRKNNFNIMVELFKKDTFNYGLTSMKKDEDTRTPEEIQDYLFQLIPKPVKTIHQAFKRFPEILEQCSSQKFINPTPIQSQLWPILLKGIDCVGIAQTGTGKTLAFLLPALIHIDNQITPRNQRIGPNCLVLSPTRELAIQIEQEVKKINYKGIKSVCVYGGGDRKEQADICTKGVEIIIATPGRLYDLIQAGIVNVTSVTYLVLDEADRMLDLGFEPQIMKILLDIRPDRQTVMTSATWPEGVRRLATKYLIDPIQLYVGSLDLRAAKTVTQRLEMVRSDEEKKEILMKYVDQMQPDDKLIVFVGRKALADNLSCDLILKNIQCQSIHGDREQCDREEALEDFKESRVRILIATDVASRGIDVIDITCVLNYDFPRNIEDYVHRVGRTGRAGRTGTSITLMAREDWKHAKELIEILKQGEQEIPQSLIDMAERYQAMLQKRNEEGGSSGRGGFRGGRNNGGDPSACFKCGESGHFSRECPKGGGSGGGGFGSGNRSSFGGRTGSNDTRSRPEYGSFVPRGRRGNARRGRDDDDLNGFVF